jgi:Zn-finger nucleic acid-binding protein
MKAVRIGSNNLRECPRCEGIWADTASVEQICADREKQALVLGMAELAGVHETGPVESAVRYLPCPECKGLMNRVNFAGCSNVIVDVCKGHGTWFDRDELRRIVEFIRSGGMDAARSRELAELDERRRRLKAAQIPDGWGSPIRPQPFDPAEREFGISTVASLLKSFLR